MAGDAPGSSSPTGPVDAHLVRVEMEYAACVAYAMQQNDVPVVRRVRLLNRSAEAISGLSVRVWMEPGLSLVAEARVDRIEPEAMVSLERLELRMRPERLANLLERESALLWVEVTVGATCVLREAHPVTVLAYNEWPGDRSIREILAAFVMPNHPVIEVVLRGARELLAGATGSPALSGYQGGDPERARAIVRAVYGALSARGMTYVNPPASFETEGQKIRTPEQLLDGGMGTCLDLAVLAAACLEQAGLHPLVVLVPGHAFAGAWLVEDAFPEASIDEAVRLRKRVDLEEMCVFECTSLCRGGEAPFDAALRDGRRRLTEDAKFSFALDVRAARKARIRPLPVRVATEAFAASDLPTVLPAAAAAAAPPPFALADPASGTSLPAPLPHPTSADGPSTDRASAKADAVRTRLDTWKRKLLDLSLRNRLLNFTESKKTLRILCPDIAVLEDALSSGKTFRVRSKPAPSPAAAGLRDDERVRERTGEDALSALLGTELAAGRLYADVAEEDLEPRLIELYRAARLSLDEGGANILYVAIGFLHWYESKSSSEPRMAPILLLPLQIERPSLAQGFRLSLADEDPQINETLLQKLEADFGVRTDGLRELPEDDAGLDVPEILRRFRTAMRDVPRFEVVSEVRVALFTFTKFLMWKDLAERSDKLLASAVVAHLVKKPGTAYEPGAAFPEPSCLDAERRAAETWCPLDADSSQLAAIFAAADGRTFVLEGPPGTGKSQTIANLIAQTLAQGKTVLFVSEKMAALKVVHDRLKKVGLATYCLELHSSKAKKLEVVRQLGAALASAGTGVPAPWEERAGRLDRQRGELNAYEAALHRPRAYGGSFFAALGQLARLTRAPNVALDFGAADGIDVGRLEALREIVDRLRSAAESVGVVPDASSFRAIRRADWEASLPTVVEGAAARVTATADALDRTTAPSADRLAFAAPFDGADDLASLADVAAALLAFPGVPAALVTAPEFEALRTVVEEWGRRGHARDAARADLDERWKRDLLALDLDEPIRRFERYRVAFAPLRWLMLRGTKGTLRGVAREGRLPSIEDTLRDLRVAREVKQETAFLAAAATDGARFLGRLWNSGEADWVAVAKASAWAVALRRLAARVARGNPDRARDLLARWTEVAAASEEGGDDARRPLAALVAGYAAFASARAAIEALLALDAVVAWGEPSVPGHPARVRATVAAWTGRPGELRTWCAYQRARDAAEGALLAPLVAAHAEGRVPTPLLRDAFERGFFAWWTSGAGAGDEALRTFHGDEQARKVAAFQQLDRDQISLASEVVRSRLAGRVPPPSADRIEGSERSVLQREVEKKARHLPIRKLFSRVPNLLPRLAPCLLMSPLSVAQYLSIELAPYDLVVFDEASQIPTWDAVGSLARGRQAIVVGDSKQLPPTSFFQQVEAADESEDDDYEDLESVLDECRAAGLPPLDLGWHYRSRHESLIAFSNRHYYGRRLLTFPSPEADVEGLGVRWRHVPDGIYDRGATKTNRHEADALVAEIVRRLEDPLECRRSIGVVTINLQQQELVENLLEAARRKSPVVDRWLSESVPEALFVKNLENVQGDERDVILFSLGYGRDAQGRMPMNFGPLNRQGGERRLNVAVTRARQQLLLFSSIDASDIDLSRTAALGVKHLRAFLDYADRGPRALEEAVDVDSTASCESPFEVEVKRALEARGHVVVSQVGCSGYRVDLGIVDPDHPGRFVIGVECDGANYHSGKNARDRDRLRESVLRDLGWSLHRIWSSDWWVDPAREVEKVEKSLAAARARPDRIRPRAANAAAAVPASIPAAGAPISGPRGSGCVSAVADAPPSGAHAVTPNPMLLPVAGAPLPGERPYPLLPRTASFGAKDDFYDGRHDRRLAKLLGEVVAREAPIVFSLAARRLADAYGIERLTERVLDRAMNLFNGTPNVALLPPSREGVLWRDGETPSAWRSFRVPDDGDASIRDAEEIPVVELANAAEALLRREIALPTETLAREVARLFRISRLGKTVRACMESGILALAARGGCVVDGETVRLPPSA